jgi:cell wall-associated NlpC family hydrolase
VEVRRHLPPGRLRLALASITLALGAALAGLGATAPPSQGTVLREARAGLSAPEILQRSFPGTSVIRRRGATLRVLVADLAPQVVVGGQTPLALTDQGRPGAPPRALLAGHRYLIARADARWSVRDLDANAAPLTLTGPVLVDAGRAPTGVLLAEPLGRRYRGALRLLPSDGRTIYVVNEVGVEAWIPGVLAGQVPAAWGAAAPQALQAAAILARSTALASLRRTRRAFDLTSDDPTYNGVDGERPATSLAAARTAGTVMAVGDRPIPSAFPVDPGAAPITFLPEPGAPLPVAAAPARPIADAPAGQGQAAARLTLGQIGVPYRWGGSAPGGFDCSGLVYWAYRELGITLPRVAEDQARVGVPVAPGELQPGDVVFFADSSGYVHHEGLYIGGGRMVHAPQSGEAVRIERIDEGYYARQYAGARRYSAVLP